MTHTQSHLLPIYKTEKAGFEKELALLNRKLTNSSIFRLLVFFALAFGIYYFFNNSQILIPFVIIGIIFFVFLVSKHNDLSLKKRKAKALIDINQKEIDVLLGNSSQLTTGAQFQDSSHAFSYDIDLFGKGSFFQFLNRTVLSSGTNLLAKTITSNNCDDILQKQEAILELSEKLHWRQNFSATGSLVNVEIESNTILNWLNQHVSFAPKTMRFFPLVFMLISIGIIALYYFDLVPALIPTAWFFIGLGITGIYLKKINLLYQNANAAKETFKQYHQLVKLIENETFTSKLFQEKQQKIVSKVIDKEEKKASQVFLEFSKLLDALDQRNNMIIGIVANGFALRDLQLSYKIETWISAYTHQVENWFEVIAYFDAQNSLANYSFNHPQYTLPKISNDLALIKTESLGHPLISETKRIDNGFHINDQEFFIITGANMAGKSTFLRTVSLSIMMANIGLPVCAKSFIYRPIKLITSMRTSDSLTDDESYFFSELKRLKYIIDQVNPEEIGDDYFIILDEILKGTNSQDKAAGSRKFVEKLVKSNSHGIIATHDLSLCQLSKELSEVKNYYFDAEIINDELHFDYTFKEGICQNMNASFLLKKMDIV